MSQLYMSKDARKVLTFLNSLFQEKGIPYQNTVMDVFVCDMVMMNYSAQPIISMLSVQIKKTPNLNSKHASFEYWMPMLINKTKRLTSVSDKPVNLDSYKTYYQMAGSRYFAIITHVIADYGRSELAMIWDSILKYDDDDIADAIKSSKRQNVFHVNYLISVLGSIWAEKQLHKQRLEAVNQRVKESDMRLQQQVVNNTIMDVASAKYHWKKTLDDSALIDQMNKLLSGRK